MCGCEHISFRYYYCNVIYKIEKKISRMSGAIGTTTREFVRGECV